MPRARSAAGEKKCHINCSRGAVHGVGGKVLNRAESQGLRRKKSWGKMFLHGKIKLSPDGLPSHAKNRRYETNAVLGSKKLLPTQKLPGFSNVDSAAGFLLDRSLKGQGLECRMKSLWPPP